MDLRLEALWDDLVTVVGAARSFAFVQPDDRDAVQLAEDRLHVLDLLDSGLMILSALGRYRQAARWRVRDR